MCWWYLDLSLNKNVMEGRGADLGCLMTHGVECLHIMLLGMNEDRFFRENEVEDRLLGLDKEGYSLLGVEEVEDRLMGLDKEGRLLGVEDKLQLVDEVEDRVEAREVHNVDGRQLGVGEGEICVEVAIAAVSV